MKMQPNGLRTFRPQGGRWVQQWQVRSSSDPMKFYTVSVDAQGRFACACPDWTRRRQVKGEHCKHITEIHQGVAMWVTVGRKKFLVRQDPGGLFSCACPEFRKKRTCAHTVAMVLTGGKAQDIRQAGPMELKAFGSYVAA